MGLDQYAYRIKAALVGDQQVDIKGGGDMGLSSSEDFDRDFAYWRKFNQLHAWMEDLYRRKGGAQESFNCATVRLELEDLDRLRRDAPTLTPNPGVFFGAYDPMTYEEVDEVRAFCLRARTAIECGSAVIYDSWW